MVSPTNSGSYPKTSSYNKPKVTPRSPIFGGGSSDGGGGGGGSGEKGGKVVALYCAVMV